VGVREAVRPEASQIIEDVPFYPQDAYQCGPASLAGVLNYWGVEISPEEIAAAIYSRSAKGTLNVDMASFADRQGLEARAFRGSLEDIKRRIRSGYPLIALVDYGIGVYQRNHFMVIVGYNDKGIIANSGRKRLKRISPGRFLRAWKKTDFWTLLILPKGQTESQ
jgi:ABC-type bacteriocin/lantibiotic exporter with double-glycine peptidase domain